MPPNNKLTEKFLARIGIFAIDNFIVELIPGKIVKQVYILIRAIMVLGPVH
jgi:hypothetical protein